MFTTPKLLEALALRLESMGTTIRKAGITGIFSGGTEFTPQWNRFAHEELLDGAYMTPTYGNTLMGLAASAPSGPHNNYKITYYAPQPRAVIEVVDFDDPDTARRLRRDRPREADDADEGVLHAGLPRARRRRARAAVRASTRGTASAACGRIEASRRRRRSGCIRMHVATKTRRHEVVCEPLMVFVLFVVSWPVIAIPTSMLHIPVLRWGQPYTSMDVDEVVHFATGEPIAKVSRANGGLIQRDMRKAQRARDVLREIPIDELIDARRHGGRALHERARCRWATARRRRTSSCARSRPAPGLPERMCRANMKKNAFVLAEMRTHPDVADARPRRSTCCRAGYGEERGVPISYQAAEPGRRAGAAVELARRAHAVAAGHPAADRAGAEAGPAGAVDAVPHGRGVLSGRHSARGDLDLSRAAATSARRCSTAAAAA